MNFTALPCVNETFVQNCTTVATPESSPQHAVFGDAFIISLAVMAPVTFCAFCAYVFEDQRKKREKRRRVTDGTYIQDIV
jgi:hypothetical protein